MKNLKLIVYIILFLFCHFTLFANSQSKICLNMIVKNETAVIKRCLDSVKPFIDYWVIVDTGSSDGTQQMIYEVMKGIPGELHERPWVNFAHNRNEALELAKGKGDYTFFIDADEILSFDSSFIRPELTRDFYYINTLFSGTKYARVQLVKSSLSWQWKGVLHEAIDAPEAHTCEILKGVTNIVYTDGARSQDPKKYQNDAQILESALKEDPNNTRYMFYLAQSYKDASEYELALKTYEKRIAMGGWDQEIYWSKLQLGILEEQLQASKEQIMKSYWDAYIYRPTRHEALYYLANYCRRNGDYEKGYSYALKGLMIPPSNDLLFIQQWIHDYGLLLELSICAYWTERYNEGRLASKLLISNLEIPQNVKECAERNLKWMEMQLFKSIASKNFNPCEAIE